MTSAAPIRPVLLALGVAAIAAIVFSPAIVGDWIYDDHPLIAQNPYVHSFEWLPRWFTTDFWNVNEEVVRYGSRMVYWRPLVTTSYAVDWQLGGGSPLVFHLMNTLYHAVMAGLAFLVLRRWIGNGVWSVVIAALIFALHPTKAESVAWIAGRTDVVCMIAILLASEGIARRLRGERLGIAFEIAGTAVAYMCKEQAIVLPVFAAVEGWIAAGRPTIEWTAIKRMVWAALPQTAVALGYLAVRAIVMPIASADTHGPPRLSDHAQAVLETLGRFFELTFAPHDLSIQHGLVHALDGRMLHSTPHMIVGALGTVLLVALAVLARKRWPVATLGIGFYLVTLLPTSNIKYTEMQTLVSERFLYLPVFGLAWIAGVALARVTGPQRKRVLAFSVACVLALAMLSLSRAADFRDEDSFWAREHQIHPDSREARMFALSRAWRERKFQTVLMILLEGKRIDAQYDPVQAYELATAFRVTETLSRLVPDRDVTSLRALDEFCKDLLERKKTATELAVGAVRLGVPMTSSKYPRALELYRARLLALRADIAGRMNNDATAVALVTQARTICPNCITVFMMDVVAHARAGFYPQARQLIDGARGRMQEEPLAQVDEQVAKAYAAHQAAAAATGPAQLQARASEL
ncbi:MAG TPA: hypothetical protein VIV11_42295, partial [Kofleriaceae bacterium]